ncbi:MAG: 50S ribosomal protein L15 [Candidatus Omnitrophica bacterium ADurb.Bin292]|mgnify:CR=1 FL=1|jgi:large subunit ribosomal protein L15|nr:MAG: 50S ribosomal protein L15 [Candidatus Omnitrophica bacterium ADurb.Bin292]HOG24469.1 50S ribosomal protein L15 [Candidatus Omnitrophota bacterium]HPW77607.1 50S ribosomal protein L15 [Candidatus Omnitrophota bacterium]HQB12090.1 50S ribosomal protein L15 [Candidatus Omnitrophota bacterium]
MRHKTPHKKRSKRLGRGIGSGHGKTSTRGHKGQRSRSGYRFRPGFEGGQNPLYRRLPKRGFNNNEFKTSYTVVNLKQIAVLDEKEITPEILRARGVVKKLQDGLKVLGMGDLKSAVTVKAHSFSASAKSKIEAQGGQAVLLKK